MRKKLGVIVFCALFVMTACSQQKKETAAPAQSVEVTTEAEEHTEESVAASEGTQAEVGEDAGLMDLSSMLGMGDEKVKDMFGGGSENKSADGTLLVGRQYETKAMGEDVTIYTLYDDNEAVNLVQVVFGGSESKVYKEAITASLGTEPETGKESEGGSTSAIWQKDGTMYTLFRSSGVSTLEIMIPQN